LTDDEIELNAPLPAEILDTSVVGVGLSPGSLRDQLSPDGTLLVFLRHFGCIFCRETVGDLRAAVARHADYPDVLFFFQGSAMEGRALLQRDWPEARAVADPDMDFYERFGVRRANLYEAFRPAVLSASRRARQKGYENGPRSGDIWRMPAVFGVIGDRLVWSHRARHAADTPDFDTIPAIFEEARARLAAARAGVTDAAHDASEAAGSERA
jgi:hypothetical protein